MNMKIMHKKFRKVLRNSLLSLIQTEKFLQSKSRRNLTEEEKSLLREKTEMNIDEIVEKHEYFLQKHPDGIITKDSFNGVLSKCFTKSTRKKIGDHLWRIYDLNNDGVVDFNEFLQVLSVMSHGTHEQNLKQLFRFFDMNLNGFIDRTEMDHVVRDLLECDRSNPSLSKVAEKAFLEMADRDSEEVSEEQFTRAVLANKENTTILVMKVIGLFLDH